MIAIRGILSGGCIVPVVLAAAEMTVAATPASANRKALVMALLLPRGRGSRELPDHDVRDDGLAAERDEAQLEMPAGDRNCKRALDDGAIGLRCLEDVERGQLRLVVRDDVEYPMPRRCLPVGLEKAKRYFVRAVSKREIVAERPAAVVREQLRIIRAAHARRVGYAPGALLDEPIPDAADEEIVRAEPCARRRGEPGRELAGGDVDAVAVQRPLHRVAHRTTAMVSDRHDL